MHILDEIIKVMDLIDELTCPAEVMRLRDYLDALFDRL